MPQYLSPGVYVEEVPSSSAPIAGVSTSIAGFIGKVTDNVEMPGQPGTSQDHDKLLFTIDPLADADKTALNAGTIPDSLKTKFEEEGHPVTATAAEVTTAGSAWKIKDEDRVYTLKLDNTELKVHQTIQREKPYPVAGENNARLVTSWEQFKRYFGVFKKGNGNETLAHAVYGFFNNGGSRCWVARINSEPDAKDKVRTALERFEAIDEITMVAIPGATNKDVAIAVIDHCEKMGDRFAILDVQQDPDQLTVDKIKGGVKNSNYAAMYFPWIEVATDTFMPPSGHMAGLYARVDNTRGVHKAPANEVLRGVVGLKHRLRKADHDGLNPAGINVIRNFRDTPTVWGARTLGGDANTEWKYINVRRLFLFLRESIDEGTQWVVFEPNDQKLWGKITRNITAFLTNVWRSGALMGSSPSEAFYVKCDAETNPQEVIDAGQVVTEIGVAVVKPAEFVIFRISQGAKRGE